MTIPSVEAADTAKYTVKATTQTVTAAQNWRDKKQRVLTALLPTLTRLLGVPIVSPSIDPDPEHMVVEVDAIRKVVVAADTTVRDEKPAAHSVDAQARDVTGTTPCRETAAANKEQQVHRTRADKTCLCSQQHRRQPNPCSKTTTRHNPRHGHPRQLRPRQLRPRQLRPRQQPRPQRQRSQPGKPDRLRRRNRRCANSAQANTQQNPGRRNQQTTTRTQPANNADIRRDHPKQRRQPATGRTTRPVAYLLRNRPGPDQTQSPRSENSAANAKSMSRPATKHSGTGSPTP